MSLNYQQHEIVKSALVAQEQARPQNKAVIKQLRDMVSDPNHYIAVKWVLNGENVLNIEKKDLRFANRVSHPVLSIKPNTLAGFRDYKH